MTLMSAAEYKGKPHVVLQVDTADILKRYSTGIELAAMNTGNTRPFPHKRGLVTFRNLIDYPYESRRHLPDYSAIVELTVLDGVFEIEKHTIRVEHATALSKDCYEVSEILFKR